MSDPTRREKWAALEAAYAVLRPLLTDMQSALHRHRVEMEMHGGKS